MPSQPKLRMTQQRECIMEELKKLHSHPAADEIYEMVRRRLPRISLGTVYRNLEILSECGMIEKMQFGGSQRRFDGNLKRHYHMRCVRCGRVENAPLEPVTALENALRGVSDYEITGHSLEFIGLCPQCKKGDIHSHKKVRGHVRKENENGTERIED